MVHPLKDLDKGPEAEWREPMNLGEIYEVTLSKVGVSKTGARITRATRPVSSFLSQLSDYQPFDHKLTWKYLEMILMELPTPRIVEYYNVAEQRWEILAGQDVVESILYVNARAEHDQFRRRFRNHNLDFVVLEPSFDKVLTKEQALSIAELLKN